MDQRTKFLIYALIGAVLIANFHSADASNICKKAITKRLLTLLGINPEKTECFVNTRRDMAHLIDAVADESREEEVFKRANYDGQYCCSPTCDRYMRHMAVKPKFVEC